MQPIDGHDHGQIASALDAALAETRRPSLILARTHIAHGCPNKQDTAQAHGSPLGEDEIRATKQAIGWPLEPAFHIPAPVRELFRRRARELKAEYQQWQQNFTRWRAENPERARLWDQHMALELPRDLEDRLLALAGDKPLATRQSSGIVIQEAARLIPALCGGSADLAPSTSTLIKDSASIVPGNFSGRNFHFGIREHAMGAILNGLALHGGFLPFGATFLVFSDYMRPAIRLAAMMELPVIYVFTHDSFYLGEDGPTHQPVEHLAALRAIPGLEVFRPADFLEVAACWSLALAGRNGPTALVLTRQALPPLERERKFDPRAVARGGYVVSGLSDPALTIVATGSEVLLALQTAALLKEQMIKTRVVSLPCRERFRSQPRQYRDRIIPPQIQTVVIEAGCSLGWAEVVGRDALMLTRETYGASAPAATLAEHFGFTASAAAERIQNWLNRETPSRA